MFVASVSRPTLVLGGSQSRDVVDESRLGGVALRRRKGGGGLVLLRPGDLWVDWWLPHDDVRWSPDVRVSSLLVGGWWAQALRDLTSRDVVTYEGPLEGATALRVVCFAGRGPGEVFVAGRKAVGLTQWRVREGVFVSTVLHAEATSDVLEFLSEVPDGLADALDHEALATLRLGDPSGVVATLHALSSPSRVRVVQLS